MERLHQSELVAPLETISLTDTLKALFRLTKPGVTALLLFTAISTALAASSPWVSIPKLIFLALAGGLMSGGSASLNQYIERDIDARMPRTRKRVLPSGKLPGWVALWWGISLCTLALTISLITLPLLATFFIVLGAVIYVPLYTMRWKQNTSLNVVLGGAAGCCPILAGWAAMRVDWPLAPFALVALLFFWTPAHFWAYAMVHQESYRKADIPMLPVEVGFARTVPFIFAHALAMVVASVIAFKGTLFTITLTLGLVFMGLCIMLWINPTPKKAYRLYKFSNYYLVFIFLFTAVIGSKGL